MKSFSPLFINSVYHLCRRRPFANRSISYLNNPNRLKFEDSSYNYTKRAAVHTLSDTSDLLSRPFNNNVLKPSNYDEYHKHVYRRLDSDTVLMDDLVVSVFFNRQSTASLSVLESVDRLSTTFPSNTFLLVDADLVPRSAYDADVQHFPSALLSYGGDLYRELVTEEPGYNPNWPRSYTWSFKPNQVEDPEAYECVLPRRFYESVLKAMTDFGSYHGKRPSSIKSKAGTHSYTHGIDTDNLNLKRVGWPTE